MVCRVYAYKRRTMPIIVLVKQDYKLTITVTTKNIFTPILIIEISLLILLKPSKSAEVKITVKISEFGFWK